VLASARAARAGSREEDVVQIGDKASGVSAAAAPAALDRLRAGNGRFLDSIADSSDPDAVTASLSKADPYAVILGCSDSRVIPEAIFDEGAGRLFVVRVAAQVAGPAEMGSVEYAVTRWDCPVVIVLGHTQCGGVAAVLDRLPPGAETPPSSAGSMSLASLFSTIKSNLGWMPSGQSADPWLDAVKRNVHRTREALLTWSPPLRQRVSTGQLSVVEAIYHVETGEVEFLELPR
jgi:carbonic anhydrase